MRKFILSIIGSAAYIIKYGCVVHCTFEYVGDFVMCSGPSMEPTIYSDDILITEHVSALNQRVSRGDIIIAKCPTNPKQQICKRVVGLPGDKIHVGFADTRVVPVGHVWLQGDNTNNSADSRTYGPVPQGLIRSRALCRVWPLKNASLLTS